MAAEAVGRNTGKQRQCPASDRSTNTAEARCSSNTQVQVYGVLVQSVKAQAQLGAAGRANVSSPASKQFIGGAAASCPTLLAGAGPGTTTSNSPRRTAAHDGCERRPRKQHHIRRRCALVPIILPNELPEGELRMVGGCRGLHPWPPAKTKPPRGSGRADAKPAKTKPPAKTDAK